MAQVKKMKEMKHAQQAAAVSQNPLPEQAQQEQKQPQADLLQEEPEPSKKEEVPAAEPQFMNLI